MKKRSQAQLTMGGLCGYHSLRHNFELTREIFLYFKKTLGANSLCLLYLWISFKVVPWGKRLTVLLSRLSSLKMNNLYHSGLKLTARYRTGSNKITKESGTMYAKQVGNYNCEMKRLFKKNYHHVFRLNFEETKSSLSCHLSILN